MSKVSAPANAGIEPFEVAVQFSCSDSKIALSGHAVRFTFEWDNKPSTQTVVVPTDGGGAAVALLQVVNQATKIERVRSISERSHEDLDRYDPDKRAPEESAESSGERIVQSTERRDSEVVEAAGAVEIEATAAATSAAGVGRVLILTGRGALLRVTATITLGPVATGAVVLLAAKQTFDVGWAIGTVAERQLSDVQRGLKQEEKNDCEKARAWHLEHAHIDSEHSFKKEHGAEPLSFFEICACKDGSILIKRTGTCGRPGPGIPTDRRWK